MLNRLYRGKQKDLTMTGKLTREELEEKIRALEREAAEFERKETALRENEEQCRALFETMTLGVVFQDKDGRIITANHTAAKILGLSEDQMLGRTSMDQRWHAIHEDGSEFHGDKHPAMVALRTGKKVDNVIMGVFHPLKEEYRWINIHAVPQFRPGEKLPYQVYTTFGDITEIFLDNTEQKKTLQALKQSEERFRALAENIREVFWLFDWKNQKIEYISPAYEHIWGRKVEDLYIDYKNWYSSIYPDDLNHARQSFAKIAESGGGDICEYRILRPDGTVRWIADRGFAVKDANGDVIRIAGITEDITERRQALEALQESEEKFRTVTEQSPNMIFINCQGRVVYANRKCEQIMGYSREEFYASDFDFMTLVMPEYRELVRANFKNHMQGEGFTPYEYALVSKAGKKIDVIITTKLINYDGERSILGIITDITVRKEVEESLRNKDKKLEQQTRNLEEMNTALKVLLEQREKEKTEIKETLLTNVKKLVLPYIEKLENSHLNEDAQTFVNIIKSNIDDLISPLASNLSSKYFALTPAEIQIADLIKQGKTSKEIASMLNVSPKAVSFHRGNLRKKLGLLNKKINLRTYLQSFPQ
jgi:PAS domain S-box-containing protein